MKQETDVLASCSFSLVLSLLEQRSKAQKRNLENDATMLNLHMSYSSDELEVEVKSIFNLRPEKGGPEEIKKLQFVARLWQHRSTEEKVAHSPVFTNPGQDIVFDMDPEQEPAKLALEKGPESGWLVVEVHRLSRIPGKRSHLLGEVVIFVDEMQGTDRIVDEGKKNIPNGEEENCFKDQATCEEEHLEDNGAYQVMIFHPVVSEGDIGKELTRRNDQTAKCFLSRYDNN